LHYLFATEASNVVRKERARIGFTPIELWVVKAVIATKLAQPLQVRFHAKAIKL
jgi:hypothetical protein